MRRTLALFSISYLAAGCAGADPQPAAPPPTPVPEPAPPPTSPPPPVDAPDRSKLPAPTKAVDFKLPAISKTTLKNGMPLYHLQRGPTPLVSVRLVVPNGAASDPPGKEGLTDLMADMLDEGAGKLDALELSDAWQRLATDYYANAGTDAVTFSLSLLSENLGKSMELLADVVMKPKFPYKEFTRRRKQRVSQAIANEAKPQVARAAVVRKVLFGTGYGGHFSSGDQKSLKRITLGDVRAQYTRVLKPEGAAFVVVGGVSVEEAAKAIDSAFADWKGKPKAKPRALTKAALAHGIYAIDFPGSSQSAISVARRAPGANADDLFLAKVANRTLGGAFTSRLNMNLREDKGYTYGAYSYFDRHRSVGTFALAAMVKRETTKASIGEIFGELNKLCHDEPITKKEHARSVEGLLLGFPGRFENISSIASQLANLPLYNRPHDWLQKWPSQVRSVTLAQARQTAEELCEPEDYVVVVAGDLASIESELAELKLPIARYDKRGNKLR